jgi:hypothetical protein
MRAMTRRRSSGSQRKPRHIDPRQVIFAAIGLLVIVAFILGMLQSY